MSCQYINYTVTTLAMKTAMTAVASSGAELPAAINVAPATSDWMCSTGE